MVIKSRIPNPKSRLGAAVLKHRHDHIVPVREDVRRYLDRFAGRALDRESAPSIDGRIRSTRTRISIADCGLRIAD
jgi:hypothetical protein